MTKGKKFIMNFWKVKTEDTYFPCNLCNIEMRGKKTEGLTWGCAPNNINKTLPQYFTDGIMAQKLHTPHQSNNIKRRQLQSFQENGFEAQNICSYTGFIKNKIPYVHSHQCMVESGKVKYLRSHKTKKQQEEFSPVDELRQALAVHLPPRNWRTRG